MNEKIKILMVTTDMPVNGISTVIYNYCKNIDKNRFDITVISGAGIESVYKKLFKEIGVMLVEFPSRRKSIGKFLISLNKFLQENKYDVIHIHGNSATIAPELCIAWKNGVKNRIAHSHNIICSRKVIHNLMYPLFKRSYTHGFACSELAGKWLFKNKEFHVIANGFDISKFTFNLERRIHTRLEMGLEERFVIGHIGRFNDQKNHPFLLEIFLIIGKNHPNVYLLLVGTGPDYNKIQTLIDEHPFRERIIMYGVSNETENLYNAMDLFVLPSKHEGLGIVMIEAQINGLPCIASEAVPEDTNISEDVLYLPICKDAEKIWAMEIDKYIKKNSPRKNVDLKNKLFYQYDICNGAKILENYYLDMVRTDKNIY